MELAEHIEDPRDLAADGALRPPFFLAMQIRAQIAMRRVFEDQVVKNSAVAANLRKHIEDADCAWMIVEQLTEVRLAQPAIDARADLHAHRRGNHAGLSKSSGEVDLAKPPFANQAFDPIAQVGFRTLHDAAGVQQSIAARTRDV